MDIRNRMADVVKLRSNVCQEYLRMVIIDDWKEKLYKKAKKEVEENGNYIGSYIEVYGKMREMGMDSYSIEDMDVTVISMIVRFLGDIAPACRETKKAMANLKDDRNETQHSNENEKKEELYLRALVSLCDLRNFVRTVDRFERSISDEIRIGFRKRNIEKINSLMELLDEERIRLVEKRKNVERDINNIICSRSSLDEWIKTYELYKKQAKLYDDKDIENQFVIMASDAGIKQAHLLAAYYFYYLDDIDEYENRLYKVYNEIEESGSDAKEIVSNINCYLSQRYKHVLTNCMKRIVDGLIEKGFPVSMAEDGYVLWDNRFICVGGESIFSVKKFMFFVNEMILIGDCETH